MNRQDLLDWIRDAIMVQPLSASHVDQVLTQARQQYGGDTVYIRCHRRAAVIDPLTRVRVEHVTRRTVQRQRKRASHA